MYISEYCEVDYKEKYNVVFVKWKKFCCNQDYRKPLEYALDIIKQKNCNYVADTRNGFENIPEDTQWVADYFMPTAAKYRCKCIYFIIDRNNSLKEELEGQEKIRQISLNLGIYMAWMKSKTNVASKVMKEKK